MPISQLRLIKNSVEYCTRKMIPDVPKYTRGIYVLYKYRRHYDAYNVVYVGRTFHNTVVILDEAQNCTYDQLKMVLTRLGENVKLIVNGDMSQSDLNGRSGLKAMIEAVEGTEDVGVVRFTAKDVERSKIVKDILISLEKYEQKQA